MLDQRIGQTWWALRLALGLTASLAGLDKFFDILANWSMYLSPLAERMLPVSTQTFMHAVGVVEMIVGLTILLGWTRLGGYVAAVWLVGIAVNLAVTGVFYDLAVRDLVMAVAAFSLARLTEYREAVLATGNQPDPASGHLHTGA